MTNQAKLKLSVLAVAMLFSSNVWAGLGRINVKSYLGETFYADIELTGVRSSELEGARVGLASPETFHDLNVDYSGNMSSLRFRLIPSANGAIIRVSSTSPINDPFLRFVVEAKTSAGRSVREYTVLLDPASYKASQPKSIVQDAPQYADENLASRYQGQAGKSAHGSPELLQTRAGSSLRSLAAKVRPAGATLEQTMAALVQANPHAFQGGHPSKLKSGVTLKVPAAAKIKALTPAQVHAILYGSDSATATAPSQSKGKTAEPASSADDAQSDAKLAALEQQVAAREQSLKDAETRISGLEQRLKALQTGKVVASQALSSSAPDAAVAAPVAASAPHAASEPLPAQVVAPKPQAMPKPLLPVQPPQPVERSWLDTLFDNLPLVGGGVLGLGLLGVLGVLVGRRRKQASALQLFSQEGNSLGRSNAPAGASTVGADHSFMTNFTQSPSAIDAAEVDPIAEAEVYIAYGRDVQAEEILKDALLKDPSRQEVRQKLLELYAARPDVGNFEKLAREFHASTDGQGQAWARIAAMGMGIDPTNPLYQQVEDTSPIAAVPAGDAVPDAVIDLDQELFGELEAQPAPAALPPVAQEEALATDPLRAALFDEPAASELQAAAESNMLDFDLDQELGAEPAAVEPAPKSEEKPAENNLLDFDFNLDGLAADHDEAVPSPEEGRLELPESGSSDGFEALYEEMGAGSQVAQPAATPAEEQSAELALEALFEPSVEAPAEPAARQESTVAATPVADGMTLLDDPLSTKLDLAKVYLDMGDRDGAREVLQDLVGEAQGSLKQEAAALLTKISN